jgi:hypothetical protein
VPDSAYDCVSIKTALLQESTYDPMLPLPSLSPVANKTELASCLGVLSFMASYRQFDPHDNLVPILGYLTFIGLIFLTFFSFLLWLSKPVILANPGMAAYKPTPATRLEPVLRKMDAPEVAALPETAPEAERAQANVAEPRSHKQDVRPQIRKRTRVVARRQHQQPAYAAIQGGNSWYQRSEATWRPSW